MSTEAQAPLEVLLYCPNCKGQHVDSPEHAHYRSGTVRMTVAEHAALPAAQKRLYEFVPAWDNPPHKSHLCHYCGTVWRPADVYTTGVATIPSRGSADTWPPAANEPEAARSAA